MEIAYVANAILMAIAVSLGVGCSTVAVTQFFVAISDGQIDPTERKMMGAVYFILRVAMVLILLTMIVQAGVIYLVAGGWDFITPFFLAMWTTIGVLYLNAVGMTYHIVPSKIGPAIQGGTWYTLGVLISLIPLGLVTFTYVQFLLVYAGVLLLAMAIINAVMNHLRKD